MAELTKDFHLSDRELRAVAELPGALNALADWHDCRANEADAIGEPFVGSAAIHTKRATVLRAEAARIDITPPNELDTTIKQLRKMGGAGFGTCHEAADVLTALRIERDGLRADALRYRWLRDNAVNLAVQTDGKFMLPDLASVGFTWRRRVWEAGKPVLALPTLDAAIDAARTAAGERE